MHALLSVFLLAGATRQRRFFSPVPSKRDGLMALPPAQPLEPALASAGGVGLGASEEQSAEGWSARKAGFPKGAAAVFMLACSAAFSVRGTRRAAQPKMTVTFDHDVDDVDDVDVEYFTLGDSSPEESASLEYLILGKSAPEEMPLLPLGVSFVPGVDTQLDLPVHPKLHNLFREGLQSGARRVAVVSGQNVENRFARVGVVIEVNRIQFGSTSDEGAECIRVDFRVVGRVRVRKVLNPEAFGKESQHFRAQVDAYDDDDMTENAPDLEAQATATLRSLLELEKKKNPRGLLKDLLKELESIKDLSRDGVWKFAEVWQNYHGIKTIAKRDELKNSLRPQILEYMMSNQSDTDLIPVKGGVALNISLDDLPPNLRKQVNIFEEAMAGGYQTIPRELRLMQLLVQSQSHAERLRMLINAMEHDQRRERMQNLKSSLRGMFP